MGPCIRVKHALVVTALVYLAVLHYIVLFRQQGLKDDHGKTSTQQQRLNNTTTINSTFAIPRQNQQPAALDLTGSLISTAFLQKSERERNQCRIDRNDSAIAMTDLSRVLVFAITTKNYHDKRARATSETWLKQLPQTVWYTDSPLQSSALCPRPHIVSHPLYDAGQQADDKTLNNTTGVTVKRQGFHAITWKTLAIFQHVYTHYHLRFPGKFQWYCRFWDDNYVLSSGLAWLLKVHAHQQHLPIVLGKQGWADRRHRYGFLGGGSGWYMSWQAMEQWGPHIDKCFHAVQNNSGLSRGSLKTLARKSLAAEDVWLSRCLVEHGGVRLVGVEGGLFPGGGPGKYHIKDHQLVKAHQGLTMFKTRRRSQKKGMEKTLMTDAYRPVAFHYVKPDEMRRIDALLYS